VVRLAVGRVVEKPDGVDHVASDDDDAATSIELLDPVHEIEATPSSSDIL
jgi:hypothetical protein